MSLVTLGHDVALVRSHRFRVQDYPFFKKKNSHPYLEAILITTLLLTHLTVPLQLLKSLGLTSAEVGRDVVVRENR